MDDTCFKNDMVLPADDNTPIMHTTMQDIIKYTPEGILYILIPDGISTLLLKGAKAAIKITILKIYAKNDRNKAPKR